MQRLIVLIFILAFASPALTQSPPTIFTPQTGFSGRSEGDGVLHLFLIRKPFHVESHGFDRPDGSFQLDQAIQFAGKAAEDRTWIIHRSADSTYNASLTGAAGIVSGATSGLQLTLRYRVKGPIVVHQTLTLSPDGKSIDNVGSITLFGIPIGSIHELIRRKE